MKRNKFALSHYKLATMDMGELIPVTWFEALPGDTIQMATSALIRMSPLLAPVMHPCRVRIHHWFVPNRLLWEDWEDFITGGEDGYQTPTHPYIEHLGATQGLLSDHLGVFPYYPYPAPINISALPFRAYNLIYNEMYRDQDLVPLVDISLASGADTTTETDVQHVAWEKDYFTTSRPWEQKGPEITIPLLGTAPVTGIGKVNTTYAGGGQSVYQTDGNGTDYFNSTSLISNAATSNYFYVEQDPVHAGYPNIRAELELASGIPINDLRLATALQRAQERSAMYGSRYSEYLLSLGVKSPDGRLNSPEYLGGGRQTIQFSEVIQTAEGTDPVGQLRGHGIAAMRTNRFRKFFSEHGIVMTLMSVIPRSIYSQGLHRGFSRTVKEDYFQPHFQHIGQQEILRSEVFAMTTDPDPTFGFQNRYDEYRQHPSRIAGEFHDTMDHWHMARIFSSEPSLNQAFTDAVPTKRVYADTGADGLYVMANHSIQARRIVAATGRPGGGTI